MLGGRRAEGVALSSFEQATWEGCEADMEASLPPRVSE